MMNKNTYDHLTEADLEVPYGLFANFNHSGDPKPRAFAKRMDPEVKVEWIKRLRSDEYRQGLNKLKATIDGMVKHCCLGVLSEQCAPHIDDLYEVELHGGVFAYGGSHGEMSTSLIPEQVTQYAKLTDESGFLFFHTTQKRSVFPGYGVESKNEGVSLAQLNDSGFTFSQIADMIDYFL